MIGTSARASRRLGVIVSGEWPEISAGGADTVITGITSDSRHVRRGDLFVAVRGEQHDGHDFVPAAVEAGAAAVMVERVPEDLRTPWVRVRDTRSSLGSVAAVFHHDPSDAVALTGVTGTNGKTTTCWLLDAAFFRLAGASLLAGTLGARLRTPGLSVEDEASLTTESAPALHALVAEGRRRGCRHGVIECSSHGLRQGRLGGAFFRAAVFTNLTPEHLDYHRDLEDYYQAKRLLFTEHLRGGGIAVIGTDDPWGRRLARDLGDRRPDVVLSTFGVSRTATVRILDSEMDGQRQTVRLATAAGEQRIRTAMPGTFAVRNLAAAWSVLHGMDFPPEDIAEALAAATPPPGRMEPVRVPGGSDAPLVLVDFAHSPGAFEHALQVARGFVEKGRLSVVFGCGGDRDPSKRVPMGRLAASLADRVVLTEDNSRSEDPEAILAAIREGAGAGARCEPDRRKAIRLAIAEAGPGDVVLIAGRGAETHQYTRNRRVRLDDRELAREALRDGEDR